MATSSDVAGYIVQPVQGKEWRQIVPAKRPMARPLPLLEFAESDAVRRALFATWGEGLEEYVDNTTFEMPSRPIPHIFKMSETAALTDLFTRWIGKITDYIRARVEPPFQTYNKDSRIGFPYLTVPEPAQRKMIIDELIARMLRDKERALDTDDERGAYIAYNVRLQTERPTKEREFMFVGEEGVYLRKLCPRDNETQLTAAQGGGVVVPARTRLVFLLSPWNLVRQILDTAWHEVLLSHPPFHHNMYDEGYRTPPEYKYAFAFDVKHFERATAGCARVRARTIGGFYSALTDMYLQQPFLAVNDDWRACSLLHVDRAGGYSEQYTSGSSEVAPLQKEIFLALYSEYFHQRFGLTEDDAFAAVLQGGYETRLFIKNYGDDNIVFSSDPKEFDSLMEFLKQYIPVEPETPLKFLGMLYKEQQRRFVLPLSSYALKTHCPERGAGTIFRKHPALGWVLKREIYKKFGESSLEEFFELEDNILLTVGHTSWDSIVRQSIKERMDSRPSGLTSNVRAVVGKDWLLTPKERYDSGEYVGYPPAETAPVLQCLMGSSK